MNLSFSDLNSCLQFVYQDDKHWFFEIGSLHCAVVHTYWFNIAFPSCILLTVNYTPRLTRHDVGQFVHTEQQFMKLCACYERVILMAKLVSIFIANESGYWVSLTHIIFFLKLDFFESAPALATLRLKNIYCQNDYTDNRYAYGD